MEGAGQEHVEDALRHYALQRVLQAPSEVLDQREHGGVGRLFHWRLSRMGLVF